MPLPPYPIRRREPPASPDTAAEESRAAYAEAIAQARRLRADFVNRSQQLAAATDAARQATAGAEATTRDYEAQRALLAQGWEAAGALLEQIQAGLDRLDEPRASATEAPGAVPGAVPGAPVLYPAGPTEFGWVYGQLLQCLQADGSVPMTGPLTVSAGTAPLTLTTASGKLSTTFSQTLINGSGAYGWQINKIDKTDAGAPVVNWFVGGAPTWGLGQDISTNNTGNGGTGNSDFVLCYDYTGGYNDAGTRAFPGGIDVFRFTPAESSTGGQTTTFQLAGQGATRNTSNMFGQFLGGLNLGGLQVSANTNSFPHMQLVQRATAHKRTVVDYNGQWYTGCDIGALNAADFQLWDEAHAATRLFVQSTANARALIGVNTSNPLGNLWVMTGNAAGDFNTVQTIMGGGYSTLNNRSVALQQILDATAVTNYLWLHGTLDPTSTRATPLANSGFTPAFGIECTDGALALCAAPVGSAQAINRPLQIASGALGFFNTAPVAQPSGATDVLASLVTLGLRAASANPPLNLGAGQLSAGGATLAATNATLLTLAANGTGGLSFTQAAANKRALVNMCGAYQFGTDIGSNGTGDFWFQCLTTGNAVLTLGAGDLVTLGSPAAGGGAVLGVAGGKAALFGGTPVLQQTGASAAGIAAITDSAAKAAITALQTALHNLNAVTAPA